MICLDCRCVSLLQYGTLCFFALLLGCRHTADSSPKNPRWVRVPETGKTDDVDQLFLLIDDKELRRHGLTEEQVLKAVSKTFDAVGRFIGNEVAQVFGKPDNSSSENPARQDIIVDPALPAEKLRELFNVGVCFEIRRVTSEGTNTILRDVMKLNPPTNENEILSTE